MFLQLFRKKIVLTYTTEFSLKVYSQNVHASVHNISLSEKSSRGGAVYR